MDRLTVFWVCNTEGCPGYGDTTPSPDGIRCFLCNKPQVRLLPDRSSLIEPWTVVMIVSPAAEGWMFTRAYVTGLGYIGTYWHFPVKEVVSNG